VPAHADCWNKFGLVARFFKLWVLNCNGINIGEVCICLELLMVNYCSKKYVNQIHG